MPTIKKNKKIPTNLTSIFYDFDGVMTDNKVFVHSDGSESVVCHRGDGWAIDRFKIKGIHQCIISTEANPVVSVRAKKLGLPCLQGSSDKKQTLLDYVKVNRLDLATCAYVGNDDNDLPAMMLAGFKIAPSDASVSVLSVADFVTEARGGDGVIREMLNSYAGSK